MENLDRSASSGMAPADWAKRWQRSLRSCREARTVTSSRTRTTPRIELAPEVPRHSRPRCTDQAHSGGTGRAALVAAADGSAVMHGPAHDHRRGLVIQPTS
jgi:hypothetical protein